MFQNEYIHLFILITATWRLASLFANEGGPFHIFKRLRKRIRWLCIHFYPCREFHLYELVECEWCNSVWFGTILTLLFLLSKNILWLCLPLSLSTGTIIIKYTVERLRSAKN